MKSNLKLIGLLITSIYLLGCAIAIPVHQNHTPQSLGSGGVDISFMSNTGPAIGPESESGSSLETQAAEDLTELSPISGLHLGVGITENVDLELETLFSLFSGSIFTAGLKFQWMGKNMFVGKQGDVNSSLRIRYFSASGFEDDPDDTSETLFDDIFTEKLVGSGFVVSNSIGYLVADFFGVYGGAQFIQGTVDWEYRNGGPGGTQFLGSREFTGFGPFFGVHLNSTGSSFRVYLSAEFQYTNMPASYSDTRNWSESVSTSLGLTFAL